ncbi:MAG: hypothetical protein WBI77_04645 [Tepidanaerobacteraceae bacterium]
MKKQNSRMIYYAQGGIPSSIRTNVMSLDDGSHPIGKACYS